MSKHLKYREDLADQPDKTPPRPVFEVIPYGPGLQSHNIPCYVCFDDSAVFSDTVQPCWSCINEGWVLSKKDNRKLHHKVLDWIKDSSWWLLLVLMGAIPFFVDWYAR